MSLTLIGLVLTVFAVAPGFIYRNVKSHFLQLPPLHRQDLFVSAIVTSIWLFALSWPLMAWMGLDPLMPLLLANGDLVQLSWTIRSYGLAWLFQLLVLPALVAVVVVWLDRKSVVDRVLGKIGLRPIPRYPQAFDAAFHAQQGKDMLVRVTLRNGRIILGRLGAHSAVSSATGERDVYLDAVYQVDEHGALIWDANLTGILVRGVLIDTVEFAVFDDPRTED